MYLLVWSLIVVLPGFQGLKFGGFRSSAWSTKRYVRVVDVSDYPVVSWGNPEPMRKYPYSRHYYEQAVRRLNSRNMTTRDSEMLRGKPEVNEQNITIYRQKLGGGFIILQDLAGADEAAAALGLSSPLSVPLPVPLPAENPDTPYYDYDEQEQQRQISERRRGYASNKNKKSENFEVISQSPVNFTDIGGYDSVKKELYQIVDLLQNHTKYAQYNVRVPKGLIFEGPPGNGKTLIAKALAGESGTGFIAVSGSEFQDKYVGVGSSRIRELFALAKKNVPCIIFIDEIDALGRKRASDGELSTSERDSTLNELLVALDGFKNITGVFIIGATNRADLLDPALVRPGRIDKRIYIGLPDPKTRRAILNIHLHGKPRDTTVVVEDLVDQTNGLSAAQIENVLNEAMLYALRENRHQFTRDDIESITNRIMVGWQPTEHQFTSDIIDHIAIHEMGHVIVGMLSQHHSNVTKVIINLSSPNSPAYTVFEASNSNIYTREALFEHLMILLAGRIAEEMVYGVSVTTGAINDFEEALKLAQKMIVYYGMGKTAIYPSMSDKYKQIIDEEVNTLLNDAYGYAEFIVRNSKDFILEGADWLKRDKLIRIEALNELLQTKYGGVASLRF
jgi:cell division protease FtsH